MHVYIYISTVNFLSCFIYITVEKINNASQYLFALRLYAYIAQAARFSLTYFSISAIIPPRWRSTPVGLPWRFTAPKAVARDN